MGEPSRVEKRVRLQRKNKEEDIEGGEKGRVTGNLMITTQQLSEPISLSKVS